MRAYLADFEDHGQRRRCSFVQWTTPALSASLLPSKDVCCCKRCHGAAYILIHNLKSVATHSSISASSFTAQKSTTRPPKQRKMTQLKLILPGTSSGSLPVLPADKVSQVPARLLDILHDIGQVLDLGDIEVITISDPRYHFIISKTVEFCNSGQIQLAELTVERKSSHTPARYDPGTHDPDTTLNATSEAHELFLEYVHLYTFCLLVGYKELQAHLCNFFCTRCPIYEAEIVPLLKELYKDNDTLEAVDSDLLTFLSRRMAYLRDTLAMSKSLLPLLRRKSGTRDHLLSVIRHVDEASISDALVKHVFTELHVEESTETTVSVDMFAAKHHVDAQPDHTAPGTLTGDRRRHGQNSGVTHPTKVPPTPSDTTPTVPIPKRPHSSAPNEVSGNNGTTTTRPRRPHPGDQLFESGHNVYRGGFKKLQRLRPRMENEYWSITSEDWKKLGDWVRRQFTHAGLICETEAGTLASEPCSVCLELGEVCEVYNPADARNALLGGACARCRLNHKAKCSLADTKRFKRSHSS